MTGFDCIFQIYLPGPIYLVIVTYFSKARFRITISLSVLANPHTQNPNRFEIDFLYIGF
jgi:hypothetical protein